MRAGVGRCLDDGARTPWPMATPTLWSSVTALGGDGAAASATSSSQLGCGAAPPAQPPFLGMPRQPATFRYTQLTCIASGTAREGSAVSAYICGVLFYRFTCAKYDSYISLDIVGVCSKPRQTLRTTLREPGRL